MPANIPARRPRLGSQRMRSENDSNRLGHGSHLASGDSGSKYSISLGLWLNGLKTGKEGVSVRKSSGKHCSHLSAWGSVGGPPLFNYKCYLGSTVSQALCGSLEYLSEQLPVSALMGLRVSQGKSSLDGD